MRIPNHACCFCGLPVLSIGDQDVFLDPYCFQDEESDHQAEEQGILGFAHSVCHTQSKWCQFWRDRRIGNLVGDRGFQLLDNPPNLMARDQNSNRLAIIREGASVWLDNVPSAIEKTTVMCCTEVVWDLRSHCQIAEYIATKLKNSGELDLTEVVLRFAELPSHGRYDLSRIRGTVRAYTDDKGETLDALMENVFGGEVDCLVELSLSEIEMLREVAVV